MVFYIVVCCVERAIAVLTTLSPHVAFCPFYKKECHRIPISFQLKLYNTMVSPLYLDFCRSFVPTHHQGYGVGCYYYDCEVFENPIFGT